MKQMAVFGLKLSKPHIPDNFFRCFCFVCKYYRKKSMEKS